MSNKITACRGCGTERQIRPSLGHETIEQYVKRRPYCVKCGHKNRIKTLDGHAPNWKGGFTLNNKGYWRVWLEDKKKYELYHRVVWSTAHGEVPKDFVVHHIDGDKDNNSLVNLQCLTKMEHDKLHGKIRKNKQKLNV